MFFRSVLILFIFISFFFVKLPTITNAQSCDVNACINDGWGGCWSCGGGEVCCICRCGNLSGGIGPLDCEVGGCSNSVANGCRPCGGPPGPTNTPTPTPGPTNTPTPTPIPRRYLCANPGGAVSYDACIEAPFSCAPNTGNCFANLNECNAYCLPLTTVPNIPRPAMTTLCTPGWALGVIGINSAIGCIPANDTLQLIIFVLRWSLGIGGGITFLLIVYSGFQFATSGGDPNKIKAAKSLLTAAVSGLFLIIFSAYVLNLFGIQIFRLPGL